MITLLIAVFTIGWVAASVIGTQAYFRGEQTKPIHDRNWNSQAFEQLTISVTGQKTDYANRAPVYAVDAYSSAQLSNG